VKDIVAMDLFRANRKARISDAVAITLPAISWAH
jgi:hypothetical protein